jgi:hypothetical protein
MGFSTQLPSLEAEPWASKYCDRGLHYFHAFYPLSDAFFRDAIEEVYNNKDASLPIHQKKKRI